MYISPFLRSFFYLTVFLQTSLWASHFESKEDHPSSTLSENKSYLDAISCLRNRLLQPDMQPTSEELASIEENLAPHENFAVARAYIPALRGDAKQTRRILKSLANSGHARAQELIAEARYWKLLGQQARPGERNSIKDSIVPSFGPKLSPNKLAADIAYYEICGQSEQMPKNRLAKLKAISLAGYSQANQSARKLILQSMVHDSLGYDDLPCEERFLKLRIKAASCYVCPGVNRYAQYLFVDCLSGRLGQGQRSWSERFTDLKFAAEADYCQAQEELAKVLYEGSFGQRDRPGAERFDELTAMAEAGNPHAQEWIDHALYYGTLGQNLVPKAQRLATLKARAETGHLRAPFFVAEAPYEGTLGFEEQTEAERLAELNTLAESGNRHAQKHLAYATYWGKLGQKDRTVEQRFADLESMAKNGYSMAQQHLAYIIWGGTEYCKTFGHFAPPESQKFAVLKAMSDSGNQDAQTMIAAALYYGTLGQNDRAEEERLAELEAIASVEGPMANLHAQDFFYKAKYYKALGQRPKDSMDSAHPLIDLKVMVEFNDPQLSREARLWIGEAFSEGKYGLFARPEAARFAKLQADAVAFDVEFQKNVVESISQGRLGQSCESDVDVELCYILYNEMLNAVPSEILTLLNLREPARHNSDS